MSEFTHASIVPLIGGETIASQRAFGSRPIHFMSYEAFAANDKHIVNYYDNEVPYYVLDKGMAPPANERADVVASVCPCAGLSMMSHGYGDDNPNNKWMPTTAKYILGEYKPKAFWGENAPGFAGKIGKTIREELRQIGKDNGYTMSVYRTKSLLHGVPQVRERSFYFFWKDTDGKVPVFNYFNRKYTPIEELIRNVKSNYQMEPICPKKPSDNPYYKYILEVIHGGRSHREHSAAIDPTSARGVDAFSYIERSGHTYHQVAKWMEANGHEREVEKCNYKHEKLANGGSIMRRGVIIPKDRIGAFVGHYPVMLTHPDEDRFITYREAMSIMGLPEDFELVDASPKNANHICQNVPVQTATDMASEVLATLRGERKMVDTDYILQYNGTQKLEYTDNPNTLEEFFA
jgi:site-specific DNA-cytosine methylase